MMTSDVQRRLFTATEYERMVTAGVLSEDDRVELLAGEVVSMSPIGERHAACVKRLTELFIIALNRQVVVSVQDPIWVSDLSVMQPDLAVLRRRDDFYAARHPRSADVLLVVEVADSSLARDRDLELPLYAAAGIPEVWIVDLGEDVVHRYQEPHADGYADARTLTRGEHLAAACVPLRLAVGDVIP